MSSRATPREILKEKGLLADDVIAVVVNGKTVDLHTPIDAASEVAPVKATDPRGLDVIRHSTAHVMADAVQRLFPGTKVTIGPAIEDGFYYDFDKPGAAFTEEDLATIEKTMAEIVAKATPFRREATTRAKAIEDFGKMNETFKVQIIESIPEGEEISLYKHGAAGEEWVDVCEGPHVPHTGWLAAVKLTSVAGAYWRGDERNPMLQRVYGTAFPTQAALDAYLAQVAEAEKRDHRKVGKELELIGFHPWAPASPFFLPRGAKVYNGLVEYVRKGYEKSGYVEVITPQVFDRELFLTSGHLPNYAENMFMASTVESFEHSAEAVVKSGAKDAKAIEQVLRDHARFGVKPMNCPGHCLTFGMSKRSYRELPLRMADFGRLHRFERSGVTQGLTRVRAFTQDDGHIFCTREQAAAEIADFMDQVHALYEDFGFREVRVVIATRPDQRFGTPEEWDVAEGALIDGVKQKGLRYEIAEGEGAFYGPKIELHLRDALGRPWQLGTMQYDWNLPERFGLEYVGADNTAHRPVMLHRAMLGSVERFFGVLVEHVNGAFPTWLAPEQLAILTVSDKFLDWANEARAALTAAGIRTTLDASGDKLGAKIRNARMTRVPYMLVVGPKEAETESVGVRSRDAGELGAMHVDAFAERLLGESRPPRSVG